MKNQIFPIVPYTTLNNSNFRRILEPAATVIPPLQFSLLLYPGKSTIPVSMLELAFESVFVVYSIFPVEQKFSEYPVKIFEHSVCLALGNNVSEMI